MNFIESLVLGGSIATVSSVIIVPNMLKIMDEGYGKEKKIPQMVLASVAVDTVFVIVLFTFFVELAKNGSILLEEILMIPLMMIVSILMRLIIGFIIQALFSKFKLSTIQKTLILLSISFLLVVFESQVSIFSGLLAIISIGVMIRFKQIDLSIQRSSNFSKLWVGAEIILFVLVGTSVNINYALKGGVFVLLFIVMIVLFRMIGVFMALLYTNLSLKERLFASLSYIPKATVQAAIGGLPLAIGLSKGEEILMVAVFSIIFTAPIGAYLIDFSYKKILVKEEN